ncbi:MAG: hypothetical protein ACXWR1_16015 [Bdellovibrionota bacterium]
MRISLFSALCLALSCGSAFAASDTIRRTSSAAEHGNNLTAVGVSDTANVTGAESLTVLFTVGQDWIQTYAAVYKTNVDFDFGAGGAYKFTVAGNRLTGFHVGPGFTVGTVNGQFGFAIFGAAGGHFTIADHLLISVDGGPMVTHTKDNTNFRLRGLGNYLGLTVAYVY